jgi:hypothetical protein
MRQGTKKVMTAELELNFLYVQEHPLVLPVPPQAANVAHRRTWPKFSRVILARVRGSYGSGSASLPFDRSSQGSVTLNMRMKIPSDDM